MTIVQVQILHVNTVFYMFHMKFKHVSSIAEQGIISQQLWWFNAVYATHYLHPILHTYGYCQYKWHHQIYKICIIHILWQILLEEVTIHTSFTCNLRLIEFQVCMSDLFYKSRRARHECYLAGLRLVLSSLNYHFFLFIATPSDKSTRTTSGMARSQGQRNWNLSSSPSRHRWIQIRHVM